MRAYPNDYHHDPEEPDYSSDTIFVICHSCARKWEVLRPGDDDTGHWAECAYCGRGHTVADVLKTAVDDEVSQ